MTIQPATRITIEVRTATTGDEPDVRVVPEESVGQPTDHPIVAAVPRIEQPAPAPFDPGPCRCLDGDCNADHAND